MGFFATAGTAQTKIIDSLRNEVAFAATPKQRADALLILCGEKYSLNADYLLKDENAIALHNAITNVLDIGGAQ